ncbi:MAG: DUF2520 domain-containing protein [Muribaculaceae bacterium]|nr:DUF2520 domain-containing protein [Muribaculaceae bacterium]
MKTTIIGTGNVGTRFAEIFGGASISPRTLEGLHSDSDLYIIAVSDNAVRDVAEKLPELNGIVVHTTGSVPMEVLSDVKCKGYGVLYPFQTISRSRPLPPDRIPLLLEASDRATLEKIKKSAVDAGFTKIEFADSEKRRRVHLTGTFACNFTNAMIAVSQQILDDCGIDRDIITPLVEETVAKLKVMPANEAQTGPAVRKDTSTLTSHMRLLEDLGMKREAKIYKAVSDYIMGK